MPSAHNSTIMPPNWDQRKKIVLKRKQESQEISKGASHPPCNSPSDQPDIAAKNIGKNLEKFKTSLDRVWNSGHFKKGLKKTNPQIQSKLILEPIRKSTTTNVSKKQNLDNTQRVEKFYKEFFKDNYFDFS